MEYLMWKVKKGFISMWLTFCFIVFMTTIIFYFTLDVFQYPEEHMKQYDPLKLKTILNNNKVTFNATWISDDEILTQDSSQNIILFDVHKSINSILAFRSMDHVKYCTKFELSADKKYLLIAYNPNKDFGSLTTENYDVINVKTRKQVTLRDTHHNPREIMFAKWSPTNSSLVIVDHYNMYYIPTVAKPNHVKQITFHGSENFFNGIPDWLYEEEIFGSNTAMWFSNLGTKLAYATFNETLVPWVYLPQYGIPDTMYDQYSRINGYHYPKVNDPNPVVELFVLTLNINNEPVPIPIKQTKNYTNETVLYKVLWSDDENLFAMWMNRNQSDSHLVHYYIANNTVEVKEVMEFHQENGWIDFRQSLLVNPKHHVALIYPTEQDDGDLYGHVCVIQSKGKLWPLTKGKFEVIKLLKWDFESNYIYYLANTENNSEKQYMYRILVDIEQKHKAECLTCNTGCVFSDAVLSEKNTFYAHICTGPNIPHVNIMKTNGNNITAWDTNKNLMKGLANVTLPSVLFLSVPLVDNYKARVKLIIPPKINISSSKKYPLLIFTHSGPSFNVALNEYDVDINTYLSVNHDIIVAQVDGRGTARRGNKILFGNYKALGTVEVDDHIIVAKFLQDNFSYVDRNKTGIWGWSYGGYVAGMVLACDKEDIFKYALSVAPVTDWIYYDSLYTERLMGSYNENFQSYRNASLIENSDGLRNKKYMLIHGLYDDNVHFQHSAMLSKELQHKGITFQQQFYPDEKHKLLNVRHHLYRTIISFVLNCVA